MSTVRKDAAKWFARLRHAGRDAPERRSFEAWFAADPAHAREYAAFEALWRDFDSTTSLEKLASAVGEQLSRQEARRAGRRRLLKQGTMGLLFLATAVAASWHVWSSWNTQPVAQRTLETGTGQIATHLLPDRSRVTLNAQSRIRITQFRGRREARLEQGDAIFEVAPDARRPFVVYSEAARITVVGTRFAVTQISDGVRVSVDHGRVTVAGNDSAGIDLGRGEIAEVSATGAVTRTSGSADDAFAWERGTLVFSNATLEDIAMSVSRYRDRPVRVAPDAPAGRRITAVIQIADLERFLASLPSIAAVRVHEAGNETVLSGR